MWKSDERDQVHEGQDNEPLGMHANSKRSGAYFVLGAGQRARTWGRQQCRLGLTCEIRTNSGSG